MKIYNIFAILFILNCSSSKMIAKFNILNIPNTITDTLIPQNSKNMILNEYKSYNFELEKKMDEKLLKHQKINYDIFFEAGDGSLFSCHYGEIEKYFDIIPTEITFYSYRYYYYPFGKLYKIHQFTGFSNSVAIGKWFTFGENGKVIEEIDQNKKFLNVSYDKVLLFMQSKGYIDLKTGKNKDKVFFDFFEKSKVWKATYFIGRNQNNHKEYIHYYIDAKTGDVLDTRNSIVHYNPMGLPFLKDEIYKEKYR